MYGRARGGVVYTISGGAGAIKTLGVWRMCVIFRNWLAGGFSDHPQDNLHGHLENYSSGLIYVFPRFVIYRVMIVCVTWVILLL